MLVDSGQILTETEKVIQLVCKTMAVWRSCHCSCLHSGMGQGIALLVPLRMDSHSRSPQRWHHTLPVTTKSIRFSRVCIHRKYILPHPNYNLQATYSYWLLSALTQRHLLAILIPKHLLNITTFVRTSQRTEGNCSHWERTSTSARHLLVLVHTNVSLHILWSVPSPFLAPQTGEPCNK